jgi:energy-coupling factor transport system ATP-binding protein
VTGSEAAAATATTSSRPGGIRLERLGVRLPGQLSPVLREITLAAAPGEIIALTGASGCGKTTLLHAVAGLIPWARPGVVSGAALVDNESIGELDVAQRAHLLSTCLDRPEAQLFLSTVRQELDAARALHGAPANLDGLVAALGLAGLSERRVVELSSGERQRLALAVALAAAPRPVLLDEPTANLDDDGVAALTRALAHVRAIGGTVLLTEHAGWRLQGAVDRWLALGEGALRACPPPSPPRFAAPPPPGEQTVLDAEDLRLVRGTRLIVENERLRVRAGEVVVLTGPNGAGKSSLARLLAGQAVPGGSAHARWVNRPPWVALMLPAADLQLFADTVAAELALSGCGPAESARILAAHRLETLAGRAPWTLSRGERQRLVHAALDCLEPPLLILDEPAQGLDSGALTALGTAITTGAATGRSYLVMTHRHELVALGHRHLHLEGGRLIEPGSTR